MWSIGVRLGLSPEDEEVKRKLAKCHPRAYVELIRSDIPELSSVKPTRPRALRPSFLPAMKPSMPPVSEPSPPLAAKSSMSFALEPPVLKLTRGELRARVEMQEKKERSIKQKTQASPEDNPPTRGKILKVGVFSSPLSATGARDYSGRAVESPLAILQISFRSPASQDAELPPPMQGEVGRDRSGVAGTAASLLTNVELVVKAASSILLESDLEKADALSVEEALALSL